MSTSYQINDQEGVYFLTFQIVEWIDVFTRQIYRDIIIDSLKYAINNKNLQLFAFVIMSNHVHLIVQSENGQLSATVRDVKKYTSKKIIETIHSISESRKEWMLNRFSFEAGQHSNNKTFQVWTHENHAVHLFGAKFIREKIDYIHNNPVRAGIVEYPENYLYSSARNYSELDSKLEIVDIGLPWITI